MRYIIKAFAISVGAFLVTAPARAEGDYWSIEPNQSSITFSLKFMGFKKCEGKFSNITGRVQYSPEALAKSTIEAKIPIATIDTKISKRDEHLRTKDFFDTTDFPMATFTSNKVVPGSENHFQIYGTLVVRGISQSIELDAVRESESPGEITATAKTLIDRNAFKVGSGPAAVAIGDKVAITLNMHLVSVSSTKGI